MRMKLHFCIDGTLACAVVKTAHIFTTEFPLLTGGNSVCKFPKKDIG